MKAKKAKSQSGQSMIEFALLVPILIGLVQILIQVESAISTAIVNQKYARQTFHFLFFNNRYYPELSFLRQSDGRIMGRYWVGVSNEPTESADSRDIRPVAPERKIGRLPGNDAPQTEYSQENAITRQKVRIRSVVFSCIPPLAINEGALLSEENMRDDTFLNGQFQYCAP